MEENICGFILALIIVFLVTCFVWHKEESQCQRKHNVSDCVWNFEVVPRIQKKKGGA